MTNSINAEDIFSVGDRVAVREPSGRATCGQVTQTPCMPGTRRADDRRLTTRRSPGRRSPADRRPLVACEFRSGRSTRPAQFVGIPPHRCCRVTVWCGLRCRRDTVRLYRGTESYEAKCRCGARIRPLWAVTSSPPGSAVAAETRLAALTERMPAREAGSLAAEVRVRGLGGGAPAKGAAHDVNRGHPPRSRAGSPWPSFWCGAAAAPPTSPCCRSPGCGCCRPGA